MAQEKVSGGQNNLRQSGTVSQKQGGQDHTQAMNRERQSDRHDQNAKTPQSYVHPADEPAPGDKG
ncbi:MAG TPA: hypothetical protein VEH84_15765 [Alphaproteobacteria bacterium]|nr:hypothetical protein [Alphaproteobacteria bacterium]